MNQPSVCVIVPAYEASDTIKSCLNSLLVQTYPINKILVMDDCSSKPLAYVAEGMSSVVVHRLAEHSGAGLARAEGVRLSNEEIILFLDSDCIAPPDWAQRLVQSFLDEPNLGTIGGSYKHHSPKGVFETLSQLEEHYAHTVLARTPAEATIPAGNMACTRSVWNDGWTGCEAIHFPGIASGEDVLVTMNLRDIAPTKFDSSIHVFHEGRQTRGYFRRHITRGFSGMIQLLAKIEGGRLSSLELYGGKKLILSTMALMLVPIFLLAIPFFPSHALTFAAGILVLIILHAMLSRAFFSYAKMNYRPSLGLIDQANIRVLLVGRLFCWGWGALIAIHRHLVHKLRCYWNTALSILSFWKPNTVSKLFFFVTSQCNARCEFCFNLDNVENWKARKEVELKTDEIVLLTHSLKRLPYLTLSGGEPFLRSDLVPIIEAFHKNAKTQWVTIPTNATLTKATVEAVRNILIRCPDLYLTVQVSLDSLGKAHDESRKIKGGFDDMSETLRRLGRLKKFFPNLRVQIATCYDTFNLDRIQDILDYCRDQFTFEQHFLYLIRDEGKLITTGNNELVPDYLERVQIGRAHV